MKITVFLQNAWSSVYSGTIWPRESWLRALEASRSGQRLRHLGVWFQLDMCENISPDVGEWPGSILPGDEAHVKEILGRRQPAVVVTCGKMAEEFLLPRWGGPLLALPHPAYRVVTNELYAEAGEILSEGLTKRIALRQRRGATSKETL